MKEVEGDSINSIRKDAKLVCYTLLGVGMDGESSKEQY